MHPYVVGVDIGGTKTKAGVVFLQGPRRGKVVAFKEFDTLASQGAGKVAGRIVAAVAELRSKARLPPAGLKGVGVAFPAPITTGHRVVRAPHLVGFDGLDVAELFFTRLKQAGLCSSVKVENDANAAALAELRFGGWKRDARDMIVITVGTGIGGGVVSGGRLLVGSGGMAGEPGHMLLYDRPGGHLENQASATAISRLAQAKVRDAVRHELSSKILWEVRKDAAVASMPVAEQIRRIEARHVAAAEARGDGVAKQVMGRAARHLAWGIQILVHAYNPRLVVLEGQVCRWKHFVDAVKKNYSELYGIIPKDSVRISTSRLGHPGVLGAAALFA